MVRQYLQNTVSREILAAELEIKFNVHIKSKWWYATNIPSLSGENPHKNTTHTFDGSLYISSIASVEFVY